MQRKNDEMKMRQDVIGRDQQPMVKFRNALKSFHWQQYGMDKIRYSQQSHKLARLPQTEGTIGNNASLHTQHLQMKRADGFVSFILRCRDDNNTTYSLARISFLFCVAFVGSLDRPLPATTTELQFRPAKPACLLCLVACGLWVCMKKVSFSKSN